MVFIKLKNETNKLLSFIRNQYRKAKHDHIKCKLLPETQHHEWNHLHWPLVAGCLNVVSCLMYPFVALQAYKLLDEPIITNIPFNKGCGGMICL